MSNLAKRGTDALKSRTAAAKGMTLALQKKAEEILEVFSSAADTGIRHIHSVGKLVHDVDLDPDNKYGMDAMGRVSAVVGHSRDFLYQTAHFARDFTDAQVEKLLKMRTARFNNPVTWMHIVRVLAVDTVSVRDKIFKQFCENDWTMEEFDAAVDKALGRTKSDRHAGGRPVNVPNTIVGRLMNAAKIGSVVNRNDKAIYRHEEFGFLTTVQKMPADKITSEVIKQIDDTEKVLAEAEAALAAIRADLEKAKAIAAERVGKQAKQLGTSDADAIDKKRV